MASNPLDNLSEYQKSLSIRIFDLIVARVFERASLNFDEATKKDMEKIFLSPNSKKQEAFIGKYIPNFEELFSEEAKKIEEEIKAEIEKQV